MTSEGGGAAGPRCLQHQGPRDCVVCGVRHVSVDDAASRVYTNWRKYMCAARGLAADLSPSILAIAKSGCMITPSSLFAGQTEAKVVGWLMATAALEGSDAVTFYRTGVKHPTPPPERKRRRANDLQLPAPAHQQPDVPCSGIPQAPPSATADVQPARFRPVLPSPGPVWIVLPTDILPDKLSCWRKNVKAARRPEFAGVGESLTPAQLSYGWSHCHLQKRGDLRDILDPARLLLRLGLLRGLDEGANWCLQLLVDWEAIDAEVLFPHVLLQSLALIVGLLRVQLDVTGASHNDEWAPHLAAGTGDLGESALAQLRATLPKGTCWCLLFEGKFEPVLVAGPTGWPKHFPNEALPTSVVAWMCRSKEMGVRNYAEALRAACGSGMLLLPKSHLEESKSNYMDKLAERGQPNGAFEFAVQPCIREHPATYPDKPAPAHVLEFCIDRSAGGCRLRDRSGEEVGYDEALRRLAALQDRLGPPVVSTVTVAKADTGACARFVRFCDSPSELRERVEEWAGDSETAAALFPVTVQLFQPAFECELCCGYARHRNGRYYPLTMVMKESDRNNRPGTSTMILRTTSVPDVHRKFVTSVSFQDGLLPAGLESLANELPVLFPVEVDSMPFVRFDFLVLHDDNSGGLRYYLNEMQTDLSARLLIDQHANPVASMVSWAEGAVGCLQRQL